MPDRDGYILRDKDRLTTKQRDKRKSIVKERERKTKSERERERNTDRNEVTKIFIFSVNHFSLSTR